MNDDTNPVTKAERLSALVDNETDAFETRRLIDELIRSDEDLARWERYHLIGDSLRGGMVRIAPRGFLEGVRRGIVEDLPVSEPPAVASRTHWLRSAAGVAVAASVAVVTLLGLQVVMTGGDTPSPLPASVELAPAGSEPETELAVTPDPRFARYLENHAELVTPGSSAFARVRNSLDGE